MPVVNVKKGAKVKIPASGMVNLRDCTIGDEAKIGVFVDIQKNAVIGARCEVHSHARIGENVIVEDEVFIGPGVSIGGDIYPRAHKMPGDSLSPRKRVTVLKKRCAIGANATVLAGVVIGTGALVGAGSVVTRSVPDNYIVVGIPARIIGRVKVREKRRKAIERAKKMLEFGIEPARKNAKSRH